VTRAPASPPDASPDRETIRLDKWLHQARLLKTRSGATDLVANGRLRVNGEPTSKPHRAVSPGDVLTFALHGRVRVLRVLALGTRRGPATEARTLYEDLAPEEPALRPSDPAASA
jgi:ribosome-associated heat shock protein Hsp15